MPFNPSAFLQAPVNEPNDTRMLNPTAKDYVARFDEFTDITKLIRTNSGKDGREFTSLKLPIVLMDEAETARLGRQKVVVNFDLMLDLIIDPNLPDDHPEKAKLDTGEGKNVKLGQAREAVGQNNEPGWTFMRLSNAGPFMARVNLRPDKNDPETKWPEISRIWPLNR